MKIWLEMTQCWHPAHWPWTRVDISNQRYWMLNVDTTRTLQLPLICQTFPINEFNIRVAVKKVRKSFQTFLISNRILRINNLWKSHTNFQGLMLCYRDGFFLVLGKKPWSFSGSQPMSTWELWMRIARQHQCLETNTPLNDSYTLSNCPNPR